jgi:hypothetical protein
MKKFIVSALVLLFFVPGVPAAQRYAVIDTKHILDKI